ncbi:hypothetical protein GYMLUDRAFT_239457 [Collybiopsis luxurians FD-317 M1]|nr:hypothetical protein GYMLUDRAFT_239457 [Collybiopsis luxurians FD-317 M1]
MVALKSTVLFYIAGLAAVTVHAAPRALQSCAGPDWLGPAFEKQSFSDQETAVFAPKLTSLKMGEKISEAGSNNLGIYSVSGTFNGHAGHGLVVKVLRAVSSAALGEAKALSKKRQLVAAGTLKDPKVRQGYEVPVLVMIKQPGEMLDENDKYEKASPAEQAEMKKMTHKLVCQEVAQDAVALQMYHSDNKIGNVLVTVKNKKVISAKVIDYGGENVFTVTKPVTKDQVIAYCRSEQFGS